MFSIVLVDDDALTIEALRRKIRWDELGMEVVGTCCDGQTALERILEIRPDIVLTDIRMPRLDGLGLLREMRKLNISSRALIFSAYDEFTYAQQAIRYDVDGFLVKPVDEDKLESLLREIGAKLAQEGTGRDDAAVFGASNLLRLLSVAEPDSTELSELCRALRMDMRANRYQVCHARILDGRSGGLPSLPRAVVSHLRAFPGSAWICPADDELLVLYALSADTADPLHALRCALESAGFRAAYTAGPEFRRAMDLGREARRVLHYTKAYFYHPRELLRLDMGMAAPRYRRRMFFQDHGAMAERLMLGDGAKVMAEVDAFLADVAREGDADPEAVCAEVHALLQAVQRSLLTAMKRRDIPAPDEVTMESLRRLRTLDALRAHVRRALEELSRALSGLDAGAALVRKAKQFMKDNLSRPITLDEIASSAGVSRNYLCNLFKEQTGVTVWDHLTGIRIELAKRELAAGKKIYEVALLAGYDNANYLSKIFRKYVGVAPSAYRNRIT